MSKMMYMDTQYAGVTPEKDFSYLIDFFYPVGCYFETSDENFNPNVSWSGTWIQETAGQVHVSAGTGYSVSGAVTNTSDGGTKDAIVPYHNHGLTRSTDVGVAAHGITQPTFTITGGLFYMAATDSRKVNNSCATMKTVTSGSNFYNSQNVGCSRTTNVGLTNNHSVTQPVFTCNYEGVSATDKNMQPYINVYRWHRTA